MEWTEQRIEVLRKLWGQGQTASQIAAALGGISRNAVIGKAHRLGLTGRPSPIKRDGTGAPSRRKTAARRLANIAPKPVIAKTAGAEAQGDTPEAAPASPPPRQSYATARAHGGTKTCSWPVGDPKQPGFQFCGQPSEPGRPYCAKHCAQAYQRKSEAA
jgi:GcrA cell cycle regulator